MSEQFLLPFNAEAGARLIEAVGTPEFGSVLLEIAQSISTVDELFGYQVEDDDEPHVIVSSGTLPGLEARVAEYVHRFYRHDPAVHEIRRIPVGDSFVQRIGLSSIMQHDYRRLCFDGPGFVEKLSFGWRGEGYLLVLSFYRRETSDEEVVYRLASLANLTLAVMVRHHAPIKRENVVAVCERRIRRTFPELSKRERQVCARTIAGRTASVIAQEFGTTAGTVLTYRRRAYQKLGFNQASDFLPKLIN
ncbi:MAG: LuxR family transcriptional regulator [Alphaproteobacteria bacterium]|nr:MAG: LuxR family transcriptional regulator [Alphaproteobacteria bacterium]